MTRDEKVMMYQRGQSNCYYQIGKLVDQLCDSILKESEVLGDDEANRQVVLKKIERIRASHKALLEAQKGSFNYVEDTKNFGCCWYYLN